MITHNRKACDKKQDGSEYTILECPTVIVDASNFVAKGITFENTAPKPDDFDYNSQAPAIRVSGDNCAFYECAFLGWQDTLYADQGKHYYKDSRIEAMWTSFSATHPLFSKIAPYTREVQSSFASLIYQSHVSNNFHMLKSVFC